MDSENVRASGITPPMGTPPSVAAPAMAGGEGLTPVSSSAPGQNLPRTAPHYDSLADAMLEPRPSEVTPPIFAVPAVSPEQRRVLEMAVRLYRCENA